MSIDISVNVRSELSTSALGSQIATFINTLKSTQQLSKDYLIQYLYQQNFISYIDVGTIVLSGTYYSCDGTVTNYTDVDSIFGAHTACYLSRSITVTLLPMTLGN